MIDWETTAREWQKAMHEKDEEIAKLRELLGNICPEHPINQDEQPGCVWCGGTPDREDYERWRESGGYATASPLDHDADCPWLLARQFLDKNP